MIIVDRRPNPKGKSLGNRRRFIERARAEVKGAVMDALRKRKITDTESGEKVSIPTKGIDEPSFRHSSSGGKRNYVVPGNKEHVVGDEIERPQGGQGGKGGDPADSGEGSDGFEFTLSREEFLDLFFEDLELPDLVKKRLSETASPDCLPCRPLPCRPLDGLLTRPSAGLSAGVLDGTLGGSVNLPTGDRKSVV